MNYILEDNITSNLLQDVGFKKITYSNEGEYDYVYIKYLLPDIYMCVSIIERSNKFSLESIKLMDDTFGIPYKPSFEKEKYEKVNKVKEKYEYEIEKLTNMGILKSNDKVLKKEMK